MATEAYCVKCKAKREMQRRDEDHHEERQAGHPGQVSGVRHQDVQDRRLTPPTSRSLEGAPAQGRRALCPCLDGGRTLGGR